VLRASPRTVLVAGEFAKNQLPGSSTMATSSSAAVALHADAFRDDVKAELVRYLYRQAPASIVTLFIVAGILAYILWEIVPQQWMIAWLVALVVVNTLRFVQIGLFFRRNPPVQGIGRWAVFSATGSALVGAVWAAACFLFLDPAHPISLITMTVILMGVAAGSIVNLASYLPSFWVVVGPSMGALIGVLVWHGGAISNTVALLAAVASMAYIVGARNVHRLLTESLQLSFENVALRRDAEQANAAKTRFLAAASHDLRQPIHALGLLFATLADRVRDESAAPVMKQIDGAVDAIDSMLNSLLDISKLDAGVVRPEIGPVDLAALLERLNDEHQPIATLTGNRLRVRRPAHPVVLTDAAMLQRILANLVSNALRYTVNGRVLVGARRRGHLIRIEVCDNGPGIPAHSLEDIFLEFHQLGNPERDRRKGLGLGLAIVKRLADLLGHAIEVRSTVGRGSRFSVTLPLSAAPQRAATHAAAGTVGADLHGRRVLVLDDDASVLDAMRSLLEGWGCDVIATSTPEEAEAGLTTDAGPPDMLIVDYRLRQHASGIETIKHLHELAGNRIPALVITGDTAPDRLREAQESGYPLLHKPVKPAQLRAVMRQLVPRIQAPQRV
jgi:signal transduction histidine kinase/ActR/RegA family two-component response regulator